MCVIVDNCVVRRVLVVEADSDFEPVRKALLAGRNVLRYGGCLTKEYTANQDVRRMLVIGDQAGWARKVPDKEVHAETKRLEREGICRSDDHHVIALGRISGARLLCSIDAELTADFKDGRLISKPRGKVYRYRSHRRVLDRNCRTCLHH